MQRVFLSGRSARLRALGGGAWFMHFVQNRFELRRTFAPKTNFSTDSGALRLFLFGKLGFCGAKPSCFSGGRFEIATPTSRSAFCFVAAKAAPLRGKIRVDTTLYRESFLFGFNSRLVQF